MGQKALVALLQELPSENPYQINLDALLQEMMELENKEDSL